ncbi:MAG TPA: DUF2946 family protein [Rubrivivax sp.]|nr:DUF2946 family protein [Rubrivivax sp.]
MIASRPLRHPGRPAAPALHALRQARPPWLLALAAALVLALAPTLSRALAATAQAAAWSQVCTPRGLQGEPVDGAPLPAAHADACVLCALAAAAAPPPADAAVHPWPVAGSRIVSHAAPPPPPRPGWRGAAPRGPPARG